MIYKLIDYIIPLSRRAVVAAGWVHIKLGHTSLRLLEPSVKEMIDSTLLPPLHKDPFDRMLMAQAVAHGLIFVT